MASVLAFNKQNLEGFGWKFLLLCMSWVDGLRIWIRKGLMRFALGIFQWVGDTRTRLVRPGGSLLKFLCRLHLKDPGCEVGAHRHVRPSDLDFHDDACFEAMRMVQKSFYQTGNNSSLCG
ncbi:hypothetical protein J1N35_011553 [Gossypium stocksii]|uniref:Uncharacterized protein n=1 Tax=Gossypium stocksii TaxID=47602 RepID=A0A9D3W4Q7_9ROSI|nr:hypothetical protein J1N35_011553 [Gossypium stocksii]